MPDLNKRIARSDTPVNDRAAQEPHMSECYWGCVPSVMITGQQHAFRTWGFLPPPQQEGC